MKRAFLLLLALLLASPAAAQVTCTKCHRPGGAPLPHDAGCTNTTCLESCHADKLTYLDHNAGPSTPITGDRTTTCNNCHNRPFAGVYHPYTINASATAPTLAGWIDIDQACGECHGGGSAHATTTGSIGAGSTALTVASASGFAANQRVKVTGAGSGGGDLVATVLEVNGLAVTLGSAAATDVSSAPVELNPTAASVPYYTKAALAPIASGMHDWASVRYTVSFTATTPYDLYTAQPACEAAGGRWVNGALCDLNKLSVRLLASVSGCTSDCTFTYDWDWGDGATSRTVSADATHTYATSGTKNVSLLVRQASSGKRVGAVTRSVLVRDPDLPPTAAESGSSPCAFLPNTWTYTLTDASTDDGPDADVAVGDGEATLQVSVDWGDGTSKTYGPQGRSFSHVYGRIGTFTVTHRVTDTVQQSHVSTTCTAVASPAYFTLSGTVKNRLGTASISGAAVSLKKGTMTLRTVYSDASGAFSFGTLKPDTYGLSIAKAGYSFAPAGPFTLGPSQNAEVRATSP